MAIVTINRGQTWDQMLAPLSGTRRGTYTFIQLSAHGVDLCDNPSLRAEIGKFISVYTLGGCEVNHATVELTDAAQIVARGDGCTQQYRFSGFNPHLITSVGLGDTVVTGAPHMDEALRPYNLSLEGYRTFARWVAPGRPRAVARRPDGVAPLL